MNNTPPDLQRIYNDLKSKVIEQKEKASEELKSNFKNYVEFYEDVSKKKKKKNQTSFYSLFRFSQNCKSLSIVEIKLKKWVLIIMKKI